MFICVQHKLKNSIRQLHNGSTSMATVTDSARITSMAKKRKIKLKTEKGRSQTSKKKSLYCSFIWVFASNNEIELKLLPSTREFIERVHNAYTVHLKVLKLSAISLVIIRFFSIEFTPMCSLWNILVDNGLSNDCLCWSSNGFLSKNDNR